MSNRTIIAGHTLEFIDCREIGQGGPEACSLLLDGALIRNFRFDPSPLEFEAAAIVPVRKGRLFPPEFGYALARVDLETGRVSVLSTVYPYMKLLRVAGRTVEFATRTYGSDVASIDIR